MKLFLARHASRVLGVLSGFDRLVFRGTLRNIAFVAGMETYLSMRRVLLKDFAGFAQEMTATLKAASLQEANRLGRPVVYLPSSKTDKEARAREIAAKKGIREGLITVLESVELCRSYDVFRNRETKWLDLVSRERKCLYLYHYLIHPRFGFMNARIQTWFPFSIQICLNGREWLSRQMDRAGIGYERRENCFSSIEDIPRAQKLMDSQLRLDWPKVLDEIASMLNPAHTQIFGNWNTRYYWSDHQSEWATDVMFKDAKSLAEIYPALVLHGIISFGSADVLRFLGRRVRWDFSGEIRSDFKHREEGVRVKHTIGENSLKLYDKEGSVLRPENTVNRPSDFKVFRRKEGDPSGPRAWRKLRRGVADLYRRAQIGQAINERYLDALACVDTTTSLGRLIEPICRRITWQGRRIRALRPFSEADSALLKAVSGGEFLVKGLRNRDIQAILYPQAPSSEKQRRQRSSCVSRQLRLLRAHGLLRKLPHTHRYFLTSRGREITSALLLAQRVTSEQLRRAAA